MAGILIPDKAVLKSRVTEGLIPVGARVMKWTYALIDLINPAFNGIDS